MGFIEGVFFGFILWVIVYGIFSVVYDYKNIDNPYVWVRKDQVRRGDGK